MKISNIDSIYDNGEFVTLVTITGTVIHLPSGEKHSVIIEYSETAMPDEKILPHYDANVDMCTE